MKVLIVTKSFVREVSQFVRYASTAFPSLQFSLVMPYSEGNVPAPVALPKVYFPGSIRASFYSPSFIAAIRTFRPDIFHIFEEFSGLIAFQCTLMRDLFCHKSKIMVYSAENIPQNIRPILRIPSRYVLVRSDLTFVCSHGVKHVLEEEGYPKPIEVFPLGVDTATFYKFPADSLRTQLKLHGKFVLGYVGRLLEIKGVFLLIEMMRHLPEDIHLLMVGSGPADHRLRTAISEYHLGHRIHLIGKVSYTQLPLYMNCIDIGIVPSKTTKRWKEQFGRVLVEFMSCEIPVVASDSGSIPEVLGEAGHLFHENHLQEVLTTVKALIEHPQRRQELGKRGREKAITQYSLNIMHERLLSMYRTLGGLNEP